MNRRQFLQNSAAIAALGVLNAHVAGAADAKPFRVGIIGSGWFGKLDMCRLIQVAPVEIVSVCDVDKQMADEAANLFASRQASKKKPRLWSDYREMLKEKDLDICLIGTPDHWHALTMIAAVEAGCDVYCQKPISVDVREGQAMLAAARKHGKVVQIGTQRRSTKHLEEAKAIIGEGKLGKIAFVELCCYWHMRATENPPDSAPPANLDYEMWTGPAPMMPFNKLVHPRSWRAFMRYGNGILGDMCVHMYDTARWMMGLGWPKSVSSTGGILVEKQSRADITDTQTATFTHDDLELVWTHRSWGEAPDQQYPWSCIFYGEKGTLKCSYASYDFIPNGGGKKLHADWLNEVDKYPEDRTEKDLSLDGAPPVRQHMRNFVECIGTRGRPVADIEQGYISTASCILANMSMQLGRTLHWDAEKGEVKNDPEANRLLARPYRAPWKHPWSA